MATKKSMYKEEIETVRVFIRIRPRSKKELACNIQSVISIDRDENAVTLYRHIENEKPKSFTFDYIFPEESTQMDLYKHIAYPVVEKVLTGFNGTIFAYGQTGTGKTYTMSGHPKTDDTKGLIPNTFSHIFSQISRTTGEKSFVVTVTYLEIYNEEVRDLLATDPNAKLEVRERVDVGVYVKGLVGFTVDSIDSITDLMNRGNKNRITRSTMMNDVSSRSHAIFTVRIESKDKIDNKTLTGKLNLVDLAGSERLGRTQATGERLKEASSINQSLSVLGNVISALVSTKSTHIPYRNSKLTRLLKDSLGGNSKTSMIAMISPCEIDYEESICTLRYASRVKFIKNHTRINVETKQGLIETFEQEIAELQKKIESLTLQEEKALKQKKREKVVSEERKRRDEELEKTEREKMELTEKISRIQKKILVGGENLYLKAKYQEFLLESSGMELENLEKTHKELEEKLQKKGAERINVEEKYTNLQEEDRGITKKIKKIQQLLNEAKEEYAENEHEYQEEMANLAHVNRILSRESQLVTMMVNYAVPRQYIRKIESNMVLDPETGEYQLKGVAYAGNNMRRSHLPESDLLPMNKRHMIPFYHRVKKSGMPRPKKAAIGKLEAKIFGVPKHHRAIPVHTPVKNRLKPKKPNL